MVDKSTPKQSSNNSLQFRPNLSAKLLDLRSMDFDQTVDFERTRVELHRVPQTVRYKWGDELLVEGFVAVPKRFIRVLSQVLPGGDFELLQVVLAIIDYSRPNLRNLPSAAYLAHLAGVSPEQFMKHLSFLVLHRLANQGGGPDQLIIDLDPLKNRVAELIASEEAES